MKIHSFILVVVLLIAVNQSRGFRTRIINGEDARKHEFPWMAMITDQAGLQVCGATLINERYVLTAAHCVLGVPESYPSKLVVRLGKHDKHDFNETEARAYSVKRIVRHPQYRPMFFNDFALLELTMDVDLTPVIKPICLISNDAFLVGKDCVIAGWGFTQRGGPDSRTLKKATVIVVSQEECSRIYKLVDSPQAKITDADICAANRIALSDACQRDSGGPLMWKDQEKEKWFQVGIVSWGMECGSAIFPGVYARISYAREWIVEVIGNTKIC